MGDGEMERRWAQAVRQARDAAGLTQRKLADKAGLSQQKVSQVEAGRPGSDGTRIAIARALGVPVAKLFPYPEVVG